jgi:hypothetical protein
LFFCDIPDEAAVQAEIAMGNDVTQPGDGAPWNGRQFRPYIVGHAFRRFADHHEILEYGIEDHGVRNEARGIHAINVGCNLGTG